MLNTEKKNKSPRKNKLSEILFPKLVWEGAAIVNRKALLTFRDILIPAILVLIVSGAILERPFMSLWSGQLFPKFVICSLILLYVPIEIHIISYRNICFALVVLFCSGIYSYVHSVSLTPETKSLVCSFLFLIVVSSCLIKKERVRIFTALILIPLLIVVFSPGLDKIFQLSRFFYLVDRTSDDVLTGLVSHYINYSMCCMMAFFIMGALCFITKNRLIKALFGFVTVAAFIGNITAGSRGGVIALSCGCICLLFLLRKKIRWQKVVRQKYFIPCAAAFVYFLPWKSVCQIFMMKGSIDDRRYLFLLGLDMFHDHFLIGIGWGGFKAVTTKAVHSHWLRTFVELGIVGGICEIVIWIMFFKIALSAKKLFEQLGDKNMVILVVSWTSVMFAFCAWQSFENMGLLGGAPLYHVCFGVVSAAYVSAKMQIKARRLHKYSAEKTLPATDFHSVALV